MKRVLCVALVCLLCVGVLGACAADPWAGQPHPVATLEMENGTYLMIELRPDKAPNTVCNFIHLAQSGFYDGKEFTYIRPDYVIQAADTEGDLTGNAGYYIKGEFPANGFARNDLLMEEGAVVMARAKEYADSASSQFFISISTPATDHMQDKYAIFGYLDEESRALAKEISHADRNYDNSPQNPIVIRSITVNTYGVEYPEPETIPLP